MADVVTAVAANGPGKGVAAPGSRRALLRTAEAVQSGINTMPTRVRIEISLALLHSCDIHRDWSKFWFLVPREVDTVAELLASLWQLLVIDLNPQVKISCQGFYIPTSSSVEILREGDVVLVQLWSEEASCAAATALSLIHI